MTTLIFPIGHCLGPYYSGSADTHVQQVRLGGEIVELTDEDFAVWSIAHGLTAPPHTSWSRATVVAFSAGGGIEDAEAVVDRLLARQLLAEVDADNAVDFAAGHRLLPLHLGLGNASQDDAMFRSGTTELALAGMTRTLYDLWFWAHLSPNLLAACTEHEVDLTAVLTTLHALLAPSATCLDLAEQEYRS
ncbi:hypothetical protein [Kribbella sp. NPDC004875]|uniref:hypothetical protein n=1 Tax=Kribbella sp. NPDC004875 TaxID=3364107 RepID=UPI003680289A